MKPLAFEPACFPLVLRLLFWRFFGFSPDISRGGMRFRCYLQRFASATLWAAPSTETTKANRNRKTKSGVGVDIPRIPCAQATTLLLSNNNALRVILTNNDQAASPFIM